jgi:hypothetical protein
MDIIYIILLVICGIIIYWLMTYKMSQISRTVYVTMKSDDKRIKKDLSRLRIIESDDRILRLIKNLNTNMTELGMAIQKSSVDIHKLGQRHIGATRNFINKFKDMTMNLVESTKTIDPGPLLDDSDEDRDLLRDFKSHWIYYGIIYDYIWIHECREFSNLKEYDECYEHWKEYYKDGPLETLRMHLRQILEWLDKAIKYPDQREWASELIKKDLIDIFN